jgi:hypothetical protein
MSWDARQRNHVTNLNIIASFENSWYLAISGESKEINAHYHPMIMSMGDREEQIRITIEIQVKMGVKEMERALACNSHNSRRVAAGAGK